MSEITRCGLQLGRWFPSTPHPRCRCCHHSSLCLLFTGRTRSMRARSTSTSGSGSGVSLTCASRPRTRDTSGASSGSFCVRTKERREWRHVTMALTLLVGRCVSRCVRARGREGSSAQCTLTPITRKRCCCCFFFCPYFSSSYFQLLLVFLSRKIPSDYVMNGIERYTFICFRTFNAIKRYVTYRFGSIEGPKTNKWKHF